MLASLVIFAVVGASPAPPLDAVYHCEACRAVLEEVEFHLERELFTKRSKGEAVEELNPRDILDWVCKFEKDQPKITHSVGPPQRTLSRLQSRLHGRRAEACSAHRGPQW